MSGRRDPTRVERETLTPPHQWMAELPIRGTTGKPLHFVPTGTDPEGWEERPIGAWVAVCGTPVGPFWNEDEETTAIRERIKHPPCVAAERRWKESRLVADTP
jgi:hypothetical protein